MMASGKPARPSTSATRISSTPRLLSSVITRSQKPAPFGLLDPEPQHVLLSLAIDAEGEIDGLVPHHAFVPYLHAERVEDDHWVHAVEGPLLLGGHLLEHRIGDGTDDRRRHLDLVELFQVALDLAHAHAAGIEREHIGIELRQAPHAFRHQLRREAPVAIPRDIERQRPVSVNTVLALEPLR